jgi:hypothetical protein
MIDDQCIGSLRRSKDKAANLIAADSANALSNSPKTSRLRSSKSNMSSKRDGSTSPIDNWAKTLENREKMAKLLKSDKKIGIDLIRVLSSKNKSEKAKPKKSMYKKPDPPELIKRIGEEGIHLGGHKRFHPKLEAVAKEIAASPFLIPVDESYHIDRLKLIERCREEKFSTAQSPNFNKSKVPNVIKSLSEENDKCTSDSLKVIKY